MKNYICALLLGQAAILGAGEVDKTKECISTILQIDNYSGAYAEKLLTGTGSTMTVQEFSDKFKEAYLQEDFQASLKQKFLARFSPDQIDEIYAFVTSDLYKKYSCDFALFGADTGPDIGPMIMSILQPAVAQNAAPSAEEAKTPNKIIEANESNIDAILQDNENVVLDVYASWCGPCKALSPILSELSNEFDGKYVFVKINGDINQSLVSKLNVKGYPTLLFYKNGKEETRQVGFANKEKLVDLMNTYFIK